MMALLVGYFANHPAQNFRLQAISWYYDHTGRWMSVMAMTDVDQICICNFIRIHWSTCKYDSNHQSHLLDSITIAAIMGQCQAISFHTSK